MDEDRLTREQMLEARIAGLERRIEQLEHWTGADEDGNWTGADATVADRLEIQQMIIMHLLQHLQYLIPEFTVEKLKRGIHLIEDGIQAGASAATDAPPEIVRSVAEKRREIIDDYLPD
ncbi:hypothetical protein SAMN05892877_12346 [Rhizobium subbaraonis]|uniref:Uncharacterized protein n=1 Tax=Rhizobium subbaraonis TaxID=908946 RepID=A0A285UXI4_9HYPH|nr:hypothetical protein [Rhizobium subbaraonis]SOC46594.1 hypothetical protein SAMN05892877_12346 [Rhizobium subbaraonis]